MHDNMGTFQVVVVPVKTRLLPCRWVYSLKTSNENEVTRFKARTVVWGNMQRPGIDFKETFSPTVRAEQIRLMIAVGARVHGERLRKCADPQVAVLSISDVLSVGDVKDAYLNSRLEEDNVLTELPPGFESELSVPDGFKVAARQFGLTPASVSRDEPGSETIERGCSSAGSSSPRSRRASSSRTRCVGASSPSASSSMTCSP